MNGSFAISPFILRRWIFGIPAPIWMRNIDMIGKVVRQMKLKPLSPDSLPDAGLYNLSSAMEGAVSRAVASKIKRIPFPGGIRTPHLHFKGDIFLLDQRQWSKFSGMVIKDFQERLSKVNSVSFEQVMDMSESIDSLG